MCAPTSGGESLLTTESLRSTTVYESYSPYVQSEIDYRRERIKSGAGSRRNRHHRFPRVRRSAVAADDAR